MQNKKEPGIILVREQTLACLRPMSTSIHSQIIPGHIR